MQLREAQITNHDVICIENRIYAEIAFDASTFGTYHLKLQVACIDESSPSLVDFMHFFNISVLSSLDYNYVTMLVNRKEILALINLSDKVLPMCVDWPNEKNALIKFFEERNMELT